MTFESKSISCILLVTCMVILYRIYSDNFDKIGQDVQDLSQNKILNLLILTCELGSQLMSRVLSSSVMTKSQTLSRNGSQNRTPKNYLSQPPPSANDLIVKLRPARYLSSVVVGSMPGSVLDLWNQNIEEGVIVKTKFSPNITAVN